MAVDKSFTDHIEQSAYNALADYYSRKEGDPLLEFPANPYNSRTEHDQYRAWSNGSAAFAAERNHASY